MPILLEYKAFCLCQLHTHALCLPMILNPNVRFVRSLLNLNVRYPNHKCFSICGLFPLAFLASQQSLLTSCRSYTVHTLYPLMDFSLLPANHLLYGQNKKDIPLWYILLSKRPDSNRSNRHHGVITLYDYLLR